jgi:hypothetical protein
LEQTTTVNESTGIYINHALFEVLQYDFPFQYKEEVGVDKPDALLLPDVCKENSEKIGFEVMGYGKHDKINQGGT